MTAGALLPQLCQLWINPSPGCCLCHTWLEPAAAPGDAGQVQPEGRMLPAAGEPSPCCRKGWKVWKCLGKMCALCAAFINEFCYFREVSLPGNFLGWSRADERELKVQHPGYAVAVTCPRSGCPAALFVPSRDVACPGCSAASLSWSQTPLLPLHCQPQHRGSLNRQLQPPASTGVCSSLSDTG